MTGSAVKRQQLDRADEILREVAAEPFAHLSGTSPLGFDQRLAEFGGRLTEMVDRGLAGRPRWKSRGRRSSTTMRPRERRRLERIDMAVRLVRWLGAVGGGAEPGSLAEAAAYQLAEGGFVDWARLALRSGDPVRELSEAYGKLFDRVTEVRENQAERFARLLKDWTEAGSTGDGVVPVEKILETIVAPLAAAAPVLLILIDGMSAAVYRELVDDITRHGWVALAEEGRGASRPGLAAIPSVTEISRASLYCGRLLRGGQSQEQAGFVLHQALAAQSRAGARCCFTSWPFRRSTRPALAGTVRARSVRPSGGSSGW